MQTLSTRFWLCLLVPLVSSIALAMDMYIPSLPEMVKELHTNSAAVQWTLTIFMFGVGMGQLFFGPLSDRVGRRVVTLGSCIMFTLGSLICAFSTSIATLIIARLLQAFGACGTYVIAYATVRDYFDVSESSRMYSYLNSISSVAPIIAPIIGGYLLVSLHTWRSIFAFLCMLGCVMFYITYRYFPTHSQQLARQGNAWKIREIVYSRQFWSYTSCAIANLIALFVYCCISPHILIVLLGVPEQYFGYYFGMNASMLIVANFVAAKLIQYFNYQQLSKIGMILLTLGACLMTLWNILQPVSVASFILPMLIVAMGIGCSSGASAAGAMQQFKHQAGTAAAVYGASQFFAAGLIGGIAMSGNITSALPLAISMLVSGIIALIAISSINKS